MIRQHVAARRLALLDGTPVAAMFQRLRWMVGSRLLPLAFL